MGDISEKGIYGWEYIYTKSQARASLAGTHKNNYVTDKKSLGMRSGRKADKSKTIWLGQNTVIL